MSRYSVYFSPTGGTAKVMNILGEALRVEKEIDFLSGEFAEEKTAFTAEDICLVGVPSYGGRVPQIALDKIAKLEAGGARAAAVVVFGNRAYDDTLLELKNVLTDKGFRVVAAVAAVAEHSIMRQFGAGRPDEQDRQELISFAAEIEKVLEEGRQAYNLIVPGNEPYRQYGGVPFTPKADKTCTACGLCAKECPAMAISLENPSVTDSTKCIACMRCVAICPQQARGLNKLMLGMASQKMKKACESRKANELFCS